jgi:hypothetical protein
MNIPEISPVPSNSNRGHYCWQISATLPSSSSKLATASNLSERGLRKTAAISSTASAFTKKQKLPFMGPQIP